MSFNGKLKHVILSKLKRGQINGLIKEGFRVVVFNPRGVRIPQKSDSIYDFTEITSDLDFAIDHIKNKHRNVDLFLLGTSYGACYGIKYISQYNADKKIKGMVSIANPFNMYESAKSLKTIPHYIYGYYLTSGLISKVKFNLNNILRISKHKNIEFDFDNVKDKTNTFDYDKEFTFKFSDYDNPQDFYTEISCFQHVKNVNVPLLIINSKNDPISL